MTRQATIVMFVAIFFLALVLRLPGLDQFMTVDEENWLLRGGFFWHELFRKNHPAGTFTTTHPGVLTMWLAGGGISWQEKALGYDVDTSNIRDFREAALWPLVVTTSLLIGLLSLAVAHGAGAGVGWATGLLLATDPYLAGMSQIVHVDALLALLMALSAVLWLRYLRQPKTALLIGAAVATGLALLNKFLPALWLLPFFGWTALTVWRPSSWPTWKTVTSRLLSLLAVAALTIFIVWPASWSYNNTLFYFRKDVPTIVTQEHSQREESAVNDPRTFYIRTILGRASLTTTLLVVVAIVVALRLSRRHSPEAYVVWYWLTYAAGFLLLISQVAKKGDRYALPAHVALLLLAAWGAVKVWPLLAQYVPSLHRFKSWAPHVAAMLLITALFAQLWQWVPYAIAYNNPLFHVRPLPQQGWGEGLDAAAAWLNAHPLAEEMHIASWYPAVMAPFFKGKTLSLSSRHDGRVAFVVLYRNMQGRGADEEATDLLKEYQDREPVHTIKINGVPYVWMYETIGLRYFERHVGELTGGAQVGQMIPIKKNNWNMVAFGLSNFNSRLNTQDVILHIRESVESTQDLRTVVVNARDIDDQAYHSFTFDPLPDSAGKTYFVSLTSPTSTAGNAITARFTTRDFLPGQFFWRLDALKEGQTNQAFVREGDLAYRVEYAQ
ncbi:MAG: phospholipid carrier-dependent glycosyltransferase [Candidatus Andersenbacteria bacterium]